MRRWMAVAAIAVLVASTATACKFSKVNSDATVHISGRALNAAGQPLANTQVRLFKEADFGEAVLGIVFTVGTLGGVCFVPAAPSVCKRGKTATTDANGNYEFTMTGRDTQGLIGNESTLDVVIADPKAGKDGPSTSLSFPVRKTTVQLPDARLWGTKLGLARQPSGSVGATWTPLAANAGSGASYALQVFDSTSQASVWTQPASANSGFIDQRILEDEPATMAAAVRTKLSGATGTGTVHGNYYSMRAPLRGNAGAPPSRHRPCSAVTGTEANVAATAQNPCPITDGDLKTVGRLKGKSGAVVTGAMIDLGSVRPIHLVVTRGLGGTFVIEVSTDGRTFRQIALGTTTAAAITAPGTPSARFVRVRAASGLDESLMAEISIW